VVAIVGGAIFAIAQLAEFRRRRSFRVAADLCREFTNPELAKAINLLKPLPDGISLKELRSLDGDYEEAVQIVGMTFETMGILVHKDIASFQIVQELAGGLLLMMWRKIEYSIKETRVEQGLREWRSANLTSNQLSKHMRTGLNILIDEERSNHARQYSALTARLSRNVMSASGRKRPSKFS
jgi:hypothetical protein